MDPVSKLTRLLEALRLQQTGSKRTTKATVSTATKRTSAKNESIGDFPEKPTLDELNRRISERISRLPPEERESDKAVQLFIDSVLVWEFGEDLLDSGSFSKYSKQISAAIYSDSKLNIEFKLMLKSLLHTKS